MGLRANSREAKDFAQRIVRLTNIKDAKDPAEIFAFGMEKAVAGSENALAKKILEIVRREK